MTRAELILCLLFLLTARETQSSSPLHYRTFAIADVHARVESIVLDRIQQITLRIEAVRQFRSTDPKVPPLQKGQRLMILNPFLDQVPPFRTGDLIQATVRLVQPEEEYRAGDSRTQWWFSPMDDQESSSFPRHPFKDVVILQHS